jgi:hypothetical protein
MVVGKTLNIEQYRMGTASALAEEERIKKTLSCQFSKRIKIILYPSFHIHKSLVFCVNVYMYVCVGSISLDIFALAEQN